MLHTKQSLISSLLFKLTRTMQFLIPISSDSPFFPEKDFFFPKPLVEVSGKPMIELVVDNLVSQFTGAKFIFVIDKSDAVNYSLDKALHLHAPNCYVALRNGSTSGALCSCLLAIDHLDLESDLCVCNFDQIIDTNLQAHIKHFKSCNSSAGILCFDSIHPRWSYALLSHDNSTVLQTSEKKVISRNAIAGFYYFAKAALFVDAAFKVIYDGQQVRGSFFISSALNELILNDHLVTSFSIDSNTYHSFYSPSKIHDYEVYLSSSALVRSSPMVNVVIPAAGQGSRFSKAGWKNPKPFIDLNNRPMISSVLENVSPANSNTTLLLRTEHRPFYPSEIVNDPTLDIVEVDKLTEGTASTILLARRKFNNSQPLLVANSDQLVDFSVNDYIQDCLDRGLDGSILVFKEPSLDPKWSYVELDEQGLVKRVAEKVPISNIATVGIYLFSSGNNFITCSLDMILANDRVNDEFYTCPVYNYMIKRGLKIGVYYIDRDSMYGLGTPEDLTHYLISNNLPRSADQPL